MAGRAGNTRRTPDLAPVSGIPGTMAAHSAESGTFKGNPLGSVLKRRRLASTESEQKAKAGRRSLAAWQLSRLPPYKLSYPQGWITMRLESRQVPLHCLLLPGFIRPGRTSLIQAGGGSPCLKQNLLGAGSPMRHMASPSLGWGGWVGLFIFNSQRQPL